MYSCVNRYVSGTTTVYKNTCPYIIMSVSVIVLLYTTKAAYLLTRHRHRKACCIYALLEFFCYFPLRLVSDADIIFPPLHVFDKLSHFAHADYVTLLMA